MEKRRGPSCIHQKIKEQFKYLPPLESELFKGRNQAISICGIASRTVADTLWKVFKCRMNWTENTSMPLAHSLGGKSHKIWKSKCSLKSVWKFWMRKSGLEHQSLEAAKSGWHAWADPLRATLKPSYIKAMGIREAVERGQVMRKQLIITHGFDIEHPSRSETENKCSLNTHWLKNRTKAWEGRVV